jgi:hypothetical protein
MTEILTESFCERCGTRYTFESARPRVRLKGVKVLSRGLKNFVLSDSSSMDEAMAAARSETDRESTSHQLDAFHKTFNFCMSCRQYTCPNCWNDAEARCLTCAPLALPEAPAFDDLRAFRDAALVGDATLIGEAVQTNGLPDHDHDFALPTERFVPEAEVAFAPPVVEPAADDEAPATSDIAEALVADEAPAVAEVEVEEEAPVLAEAVTVADAWATEDVAEEPLVAAAPVLADETFVAEEARPEEPAAPLYPADALADPAGKAAAQTTGLLQRFRPGQSLDDALAAFERERAEPELVEAAAEPEPEPELELEPVEAAAEPELVEAAAEPEPELAAEAAAEEIGVVAGAPASQVEPEAAPKAPVAVPEPEQEPVAATAEDVVEQPTWRITAPDPTAPLPLPGGEAGVPLQARATPTLEPGGEPQWPAQPQWRSSTPAAGLPFLGRPATPEGGIDALWAASNQELVTAAPSPQGKAASGIQPCISCGLSLSANARFCRRCGTLQGR